MKNPPSKFAHNRPRPFFSVLAWLPKRPKKRNPVPPKVPYCRTGYLDWGIFMSPTIVTAEGFSTVYLL